MPKLMNCPDAPKKKPLSQEESQTYRTQTYDAEVSEIIKLSERSQLFQSYPQKAAVTQPQQSDDGIMQEITNFLEITKL